MNKLLPVTFWVIIFGLSVNPTIYAQHQIITFNTEIATLELGELNIDGDKVSFVKKGEDIEHHVSIHDVFNINFEAGVSILTTLISTFDTIDCKIKSVSLDGVTYIPEGNGDVEFIDRKKIVAVFIQTGQDINELQNASDQKLNSYRQSFYVNQRVLNKDGNYYKLNRISYLRNDTAALIIEVKGHRISSKAYVYNLKNIGLKGTYSNEEKSNAALYLVSDFDDFDRISSLEIDTDTIIVRSTFEDKISEQKLPSGIVKAFKYINDPNRNYSVPVVEKHKSYKIEFNVGYGHRIATLDSEASPEMIDYIDDLRGGPTIDISFIYFPKKHLGIGVDYNQYTASNSISTQSEDIDVKFIGPNVIANFPIGKTKGNLFFGGALGYIAYKNDLIVSNEVFFIKGQSFGAKIGVGVDFYLGKTICIGIKGNLVSASVYDFTANGEKITEELVEDLSRVDIMGGVKFYF